MHPKVFETLYIRKNYVDDELRKHLKEVQCLNYRSLNDYDRGVYDGYVQAITEILKKIERKFSQAG
ncbi:hypothetical protein [Leptospira noguchii]|uniref:Uncharacterized protein n=5 Tax=Leptospira noguchii TaxID=28182 RepID=M6YYM1_9LEPT|nr:hypothetical protein [Leptospira noguchii]EKR72700.1 hypothetical protein LEP1GSC041_3978 [Leptospira noguchii str. 2006001870]EMI62403.1 hypothetical protein LEP1GSC072_3936 [Leptospira noguchii str. Bonito]EMM99907.1 hypothetical protein LEP1GSC035_0765 [Leptospira noguchii str. 2007001578]EMO41729.1 hypothetical protein LEP1GSC186_2115 [Leptospira noguchii serovar Autumnalis str. ZUN142]EMO91423.1 hypothetical protein LEP1GSC024_3027 [Leptospira noguchii str. 2001034031]